MEEGKCARWGWRGRRRPRLHSHTCCLALWAQANHLKYPSSQLLWWSMIWFDAARTFYRHCIRVWPITRLARCPQQSNNSDSCTWLRQRPCPSHACTVRSLQPALSGTKCLLACSFRIHISWGAWETATKRLPQVIVTNKGFILQRCHSGALTYRDLDRSRSSSCVSYVPWTLRVKANTSRRLWTLVTSLCCPGEAFCLSYIERFSNTIIEYMIWYNSCLYLTDEYTQRCMILAWS